jgi:nitrous oxidase accessory protein NosD
MFAVLVVLVLMMGMLSTAMLVSAKPRAIHVYEGQSIQEAVNAASDGDKIIVHAGTYNEQVIVDKALTLQGSDAVLDLDGISFNDGKNGAIWVEAAGATVSGFTIKNVPYCPNPVNPTWLPFAFLEVENRCQ